MTSSEGETDKKGLDEILSCWYFNVECAYIQLQFSREQLFCYFTF